MKVQPTELPEVLLVESKAFGDDRGFFFEAFVQKQYAEHGIDCDFVQDNFSRSARGVIRGLHLQLGERDDSGQESLGQVNLGQAKFVRALRGRILDVAVDVRRNSPSFGKWVGVELSEENHRALFIPAGFAHGFAALEEADVLYKCSDYYRPELERGIAWNDETLNIDWPIDEPLISPRDAELPTLSTFIENNEHRS